MLNNKLVSTMSFEILNELIKHCVCNVDLYVTHWFNIIYYTVRYQVELSMLIKKNCAINIILIWFFLVFIS